ncbi:MAG: DUF2283 domain-containing protein [bacterium]|nr:DUF2283 domain-containing protein [bacterium]
MQHNIIPQLKYEPEADILSWEVSKEPIDYAKEIGNFVVHFSKNGTPILVEVLQAKDFMKKAEHTVGIRRVHPEMVTA